MKRKTPNIPRPAKAPRSAPSGVQRKAAGGRFGRPERVYEVAIPSRVEISAIINADPGITFGMLAGRLGLVPAQGEGFGRRVDAMLREDELSMKAGGRLYASRAPQRVVAVETGVVSRHRDGFGFITPASKAPRNEGTGGIEVRNSGGDLFVAPASLEGVMHGDTVTFVRRAPDARGRQEARIAEVVERAVTRVVGKLKREGKEWTVVPRDRNFSHAVAVGAKPPLGAEGDVVTASITHYPQEGAGARGEVTEVLGNEDDAGIEIEIALRKFDLPHVFSKAALAEAGALPEKLRKSDYADRIDLTHLPLVTIDGEDARDFDDAVYCEPLKKTAKGASAYRLIVAIADVSHYVIPGKPLDADARERSTSIYFPRRVIPMLPEKLSNGLCSLNPDVDRLVMACDMKVSAAGEIREYAFYPAVMHSQARFTYTEVASILADPAGPAAKKRNVLAPHLQALEQVYHALLLGRGERGAIDFESMESKMLFNPAGRIERVVQVVRNDAHKLIEECMLAANVCAASLLEQHKHPALYRIHAGPTPAKLEVLREFLGGLGLPLGGGDDPQAKDYAKLSQLIKGRPDALLVSSVMLRSMQQAQYSPDNIGHFGLAYEKYAHFTSPIRRYPDLLVHRAIKAVIKQRKYHEDDWEALGVHCSKNERRADEASREVTSWLKCMYAREHLGAEFGGAISGVTNFGVFVTLDELLIDGMIHISELGSGFLKFDAAQHALVAERSGHSYRLGQRLRVKIVRADPDALKIDLALAAVQSDDSRDQRAGAAPAGWSTSSSAGATDDQPGSRRGTKATRTRGAKGVPEMNPRPAKPKRRSAKK